MPSATIKLFLVQGDAKRLRSAELSNWNGKAVAGPRSELDSLLSREESLNSGVYFLTGVDPETGRHAVYVGEAECIRDRLKCHNEKEFWNHATFFVSKDENLTKSHIRYLEGRLIEQAKAAGRSLVVNGQSSGAKLPESDREDMEIFLDRIHQLLPVLGADFLLPTSSSPQSRSERPLYHTELKGLRASGHVSPEGFVVLRGSQAVFVERQSCPAYLRSLRQRLIGEGVLTSADNCWNFVEDKEFSSPSAAAALVHGGPVNGLLCWKTEDGKTLKEIESLQQG